MKANIEILSSTKNPLSTIGENASHCYNTNLKDDQHARRIAEHCIRSGHGRNLEFADVTMKISGISARVGRELYTHIIGTTRVQSSTRYITYKDFLYFIPEELTGEGLEIYINAMNVLREAKWKLGELGYSNDVTGYCLPMSMDTTIVLKINARALIHMANLRLCGRALREFRKLMRAIKKSVSEIDSEWNWIADNYMVPKCVSVGYCNEDYQCRQKIRPKVSEITIMQSADF